MSKELVIGSNRHETKVAVLEDDQLVEVYFQRANEYSLAGSIHKGRVTRVLPGMQSAFVDLGLERDTFLYVSDFFEEQEDIDTVPDEKPARGERSERNGNRGRQVVRPIVTAQEIPAAATADAEQAADLEPGEAGAEAPQAIAGTQEGHAPEQSGFRGDRGRRSRRRRQRGRGFPENKYAHPSGQPSRQEAEALPVEPAKSAVEAEEVRPEVILLPGESLAKYRNIASTPEASHHEEPEEEHQDTPWDKTDDAATEEELAEEAEEIALADRVFAHHDEEVSETTEEDPLKNSSAVSDSAPIDENQGSQEEVAELDPVVLPEKHEPSDAPLANQEPIALDEYEVLAIREGLTGIDEPLLDALPSEETPAEEPAKD